MGFLQALLLSLAAQSVAAYQPCGLLGPDFPAPTNLARSARLQDAFTNFTETFEAALASGTTSTHGKLRNDTSYSIQFFSLDNKKPIYEYYYTSSTLDSSISGVKKVGADTIYRVGSISKLFTVYTLLAEIGDAYWDRPVTDFIPELRSSIPKSRQNPIEYTAWEDISLGALAGQLAGVARDIESPGGVLLALKGQDVTKYGLPVLHKGQYPACVLNGTHMCDRKEFFAKHAQDTRAPAFAPNTTPTYSNAAFQILAYALESIVGVKFPKLLERSIIQPLGLNSTSYYKPATDKYSVIPADPTTSYYNADLGETTPDGGIYSSANDLAKLGRSILSSTLLDPNTTRAWLKPHTFTSSMNAGVGRPWEIYRMLGPLPSNRVSDIYTKDGDIGLYHSTLALMPDYNFGWTILCAGPGGNEPIDGIIADTVLSQIETVAREQAQDNYGGSYHGTNGLNSSLTLTTTPGMPGLGVKDFVSNGTRIFDILAELEGIPPSQLYMRLYPTGLEHDLGNGTKEVAFRATYNIDGGENTGPFAACTTWFAVDALVYGQVATDLFVFTLDKDGKVLSVSPRAVEATLEKD